MALNAKLRIGDVVEYEDGFQATVYSVSRFIISLNMEDGETGHVHPDDAEKVLTLVDYSGNEDVTTSPINHTQDLIDAGRI